MATDPAALDQLQASEAIPIAQLKPDTENAPSRVVDGIVTVTWPFSIVKNSLAFILAERDVLLRRNKGQLRVQLNGPAANALNKAGFGGGDALRLGLQGAEWKPCETQTRLPGDTLEWQLGFTNRLLLRIRKTDINNSETEETINIDAAETEPPPAIEATAETPPQVHAPASIDVLGPEPQTPVPSTATKRLASAVFENGEYSSPAFIKRARVSYGSLFEGGFEALEQDSARKALRPKRSRFSMGGSIWKYSSRSPSPDPSVQDGQPDEVEEDSTKQDHPIAAPQSSTVPVMVDEGCQTQDMDFDPSVSVGVSNLPRQPLEPHISSPSPMFSADRSTTNAASTHSPRNPASDQINHSHAPGSPSDAATSYGSHMTTGLDPGFNFGLPITQNGLYGGEYTTAAGASIPTNPVESVHAGATRYLEALGDHDLHIDPSLQFHAAMDEHTSSEYPTIPHELSAQGQSIYHVPQAAEHMTWIESPAVPDPPTTSTEDSIQLVGSSSPAKQKSPPDDGTEEYVASTAGIPSAAEFGEEGDTELVDRGPIGSSAVSVNESGREAESGDDGDLPGEDYDLRNYDPARDDDDTDPEEGYSADENDVVSLVVQQPYGDEEESGGEGADSPVVNDENENESYNSQVPIKGYERKSEFEVQSDEEASDVSEGHYEDDGIEEGYDEDEYDDEGRPFADEQGEDGEEGDAEDYEKDYEEYSDEEDYEQEAVAPPIQRSMAPKEPVIISLLSDSEEEEEEPAKPPAASTRPPPQLNGAEDDGLYNEAEEGVHEPAAGDADAMETELTAETPESPTSDLNDKYGSPAPEELHRSQASEDDEQESANQREHAETPKPNQFEDESRQHHHAQTDDTESFRHAMTVEEAGKPNLSADSPLAAPASVPDRASHPVIKPNTNASEDYDRSRALQHAEVERHDTQGHNEHAEGAVVEPTDDNTKNTTSADYMDIDDHDAEAVGKDGGNLQIPPTRDPEPQEDRATPDAAVSRQPVGQISESHDIEAELEDVPVTKQREESPPAANADAAQPAQPPATTASDDGEMSAPGPTASGSAADADEDIAMEEEAAVAGDGGRDSQATPDKQDRAEAEFIQEDQPIQADTENTKSPPATQPPHEAETTNKGEDALTEKAGRHAYQEIARQLPTPKETQQAEELGETPRANLDEDATNDDNNLGPEEQIMAEFLQSTSSQVQAKDSNRALRVEVQVQRQVADVSARPSTIGTKAEREILITTQSLRSRGHRKTRSSDSAEYRTPDPSIALARATPATRSKKAEKSEDNESPPVLRVTRSKADQSDPSVAIAKGLGLSGRGIRGAGSPESPRELRGASQSTRRSHTPDSSAEALKSPSVTGSVRSMRSMRSALGEEADAAGSKPGITSSKQQLLKCLRTTLPDFLSLKALRSGLGQATDILAVCTTTPPSPHRPKNGPRDYMMEVIITDPSLAPSGVAVAHIFRPHQASLPVIHEGDVVLLRRFQVVSMKGRGFGVRAGDASAWAVFEKADDEMLPQIKGAPVEVTDEEADYAGMLKQWWAGLDAKSLARVDNAGKKMSLVGKDDTK
ncbi:hypothetical protein S40293_05767 [Stachybotrys chartarum IBT 40293]|nr:hypothetical protein S40293_05767 [Stachybotrys chartarum IBT 40293]